MSEDIATLGIQIDASSADEAAKKLDRVAESGARAEIATTKLTKASTYFSSEYNKARQKSPDADRILVQVQDAIMLKRVTEQAFPFAEAQAKVAKALADTDAMFAAGKISAEKYGGIHASLTNQAENFAAKEAKAVQVLSGHTKGLEKLAEATDRGALAQITNNLTGGQRREILWSFVESIEFVDAVDALQKRG